MVPRRSEATNPLDRRRLETLIESVGERLAAASCRAWSVFHCSSLSWIFFVTADFLPSRQFGKADVPAPPPKVLLSEDPYRAKDSTANAGSCQEGLPQGPVRPFAPAPRPPGAPHATRAACARNCRRNRGRAARRPPANSASRCRGPAPRWPILRRTGGRRT